MGHRGRTGRGRATDLLRPPTSAAPDGGVDRPGYGFFHVALDETATHAVAAPDRDATVNDMLVAAAHLTIDAWNDTHGRSSGRISVLVPVNLRPTKWREDIVTNMVLDARVATGPLQRTTPASTLAAVVAQIEKIKAGGGAALIEVLGGMSRLPLWAKQPLSPLLSLTGNRLVDSAIVSNLGELEHLPRFGDDAGATRDVWFSAPCRMPCAISIGAASVAGRLHLAFRYRHPVFSAGSVGRFAELFVTQLARTAAAATR